MNALYELGFSHSQHELDLPDIPVRGHIPDWLQGMLFRNGPGTFQVGQQHYRHWFDGLAMLHRFTFSGGKVSYANKFLACNAYHEAQATGQISYSEFATDPCRSLFARVMTVFEPRISDSAKVSIARIAQRYLALAETPIQVQFDPQTLRSVGVFQYEPNPVGQMTTVHPQFDFGSDEVFNLVTRYHRISHYNFCRMRGSAAPELAASLPVNEPAYLHSFGMSPRYLILAEFPLVVNPLALLLWLRPYIENFRWKPERGAAFFVFDRNTGALVGRFETESFFAFHHVNAFEVGDELVVDIDAYPDAGIIQSYYLDRLKEPGAELPFGNLRRYRLPLKRASAARGKAVTVAHELISPECMELASFDGPRFNMRPDYRYVYSISINPGQRSGFYNQLLKVDVQTGQSRTWFQPGCYPGEPIFAGRPGRTAEDDGVILSVVLDTARAASFLLVLDAATFQEIARAELPQPVLIGYHGAFFPDQQAAGTL
jgi:beta,beta-carotene 9',10'-dioxygenase